MLPTSLGGDAVRIYETAKRHPGTAGVVAGSGAARARARRDRDARARRGRLRARLGRYDVGAYLWLELALRRRHGLRSAFVALLVPRARSRCAASSRCCAGCGSSGRVRAVYEGVHAYRKDGRLLVWLAVVTLGVQAVRMLAIWLCARGGRDRPLRARRST